MTPERAKELFDKMPPHLKEQVLKIDRAMKKKEDYNIRMLNKKIEINQIKTAGGQKIL